MQVLVTGGCGFVGHVLVPQLLKLKHEVTVYDTLWYGNFLPNHKALTVVKGDIRDSKLLDKVLQASDYDAVVHLAAISNDASFELDEALSTSVNRDAFEPLVRLAKGRGVKRFVYASTSSVYGTSNAPEVTEEHPLVPLTLYNRYKGECEPVLRGFESPSFTTVILRPATLCGYSPRQRLDLALNTLTKDAYLKHKVTVNGGTQMRPMLHVKDMVRAYLAVLEAPKEVVAGQTFNVAGSLRLPDNLALGELAEHVVHTAKAHGLEVKLKVVPSGDDRRSYRVDASKFRRRLDWRPTFDIRSAIIDLFRAFHNHLLPDALNDPRYYNVRRMQQLQVK